MSQDRVSAGVAEDPIGPGSVTGVPDLPAGFGDTFRSRYVDTGRIRQHVVTGGRGPVLFLLGGWPQTWYAWRLVMPALAEHHTVVAIDPRGSGLSDKPTTGYDSRTAANDVVALADALDVTTFTLVGHDIGMWTGYALAADHPHRLERLVVVDAIIPGVSPSPPLIGNGPLNAFLWHFSFNRVDEINEQLVHGREDIYFGHQFASKAGSPDAIPASAVSHYVAMLRTPEALRASFGPYRALDEIIAQNAARREHRLRLPVLTLAGERSCGDGVETDLRLVADDVTAIVVADCGHFLPEEAPQALVSAVTEFLAPRARVES
jgi:pimeloyl-ACP methyl ester carboxylesterase